MSSINSFADALFRFMFGWARTLLQQLWNAAFSGGFSGFYTWLGDHWLLVTVALCLAGTAVDFTVWMIRWRPYLVWRTKLRRLRAILRGEGSESTAPRQFAKGYQEGVALDLPVNGSAQLQPEDPWQEEAWAKPAVQQQPPQPDPIASTSRFTPPQPAAAPTVYAVPDDQTSRMRWTPLQEAPCAPAPAPSFTQPPVVTPPVSAYAPPPVYTPVPAPLPQTPAPAQAAPPSMDSGRQRRFAPVADYEPPPMEASDRPNSAYPTDMPEARRKRRSDKYDRKRATWRQRLVSVTEEEEGMLDGLPPAVDRQEAFHEPVYPQQHQALYPGWPQNSPTNGKQSV